MPATRGVSDDDREIAQRIRSARVASGVTQRELARTLGVSVQQMTKYEQAYNRLSAGILLAIARTLEVPVADLVGENGPVSLVPRVRAATNLVRDFCMLDADLQDVVVKLVRTLASRATHSSPARKSRRSLSP
jgi:transcriptional regulator with XRE-family HTH domain